MKAPGPPAEVPIAWAKSAPVLNTFTVINKIKRGVENNYREMYLLAPSYSNSR